MSRIATLLSLTLNIVNFYEDLLHTKCKETANILEGAVIPVCVCVCVCESVCRLCSAGFSIWHFDFVWFCVLFFHHLSPSIMTGYV